MMNDPRVDRLADILVHYSTDIKPKDHVAIYGSPDAEPLMRAVYSRVLQAGGYPYAIPGYEVYPGYTGFDDIHLAEANEDQLRHVSRIEHMARTEFEAIIFIRSPRNTRFLSGVDPEAQRIRNLANSDLQNEFHLRSALGEMKWVLSTYPNKAQAQEAAMSLDEFTDFVYSASHADQEDPIAAWKAVREQQERLVQWLEGKRKVEVNSANVQMSLSIEGRRFINACGDHNMPDGEIFTGPVEDSVEGWARFTFPAVRYGVEVEGAEFRFEGGRIVEARASKNEEFLVRMLDSDEHTRRLGEWAIGTNDQIRHFSNNILFDEKLGGTIHMAIGRGFPETGSKNEGALHWDFITELGDGGEIRVDGELFYRDGQFQL
jgi:aminopeptidase